jgi:hypothetical protein
VRGECWLPAEKKAERKAECEGVLKHKVLKGFGRVAFFGVRGGVLASC